MPKVKPLPSELRRRKLSGTMKKHVEMKYGKVTAELFGKCIGMQRTAAKARMDDPGEVMLCCFTLPCWPPPSCGWAGMAGALTAKWIEK